MLLSYSTQEISFPLENCNASRTRCCCSPPLLFHASANSRKLNFNPRLTLNLKRARVRPSQVGHSESPERDRSGSSSSQQLSLGPTTRCCCTPTRSGCIIRGWRVDRRSPVFRVLPQCPSVILVGCCNRFVGGNMVDSGCVKEQIVNFRKEFVCYGCLLLVQWTQNTYIFFLFYVFIFLNQAIKQYKDTQKKCYIIQLITFSF